MFYHLAQVSPSAAIGSGISSANEAAAKAIASEWDARWTTFFDAGLYQAINNSMLGVALLFFIITAVLTTAQWMQSHNDELFTKLIAPFLILMLLINGGALTRQMIYTVRIVSNNLDGEVFRQLNLAQTLNARVDDLQGEQDALLEIQKKADNCKSSNAVSNQVCLDSFHKLVQQKIGEGKIKNRGVLDKLGSFVTSWGQNIANRATTGAGVGGSIGSPGSPDSVVGATVGVTLAVADAALSPIRDGINQILLTPVMAVVFFLMMAITSAVQNMAEASMLLTSLIAPMYITAALLPNGMKSIVALCTSYWGIISYKLCYIIIVGLCSQMMIDNSSTNTIVLSVITGLGAPILAGILAKGAGMGFFHAAEGAVAKGMSFAADIGMGFATGGSSAFGSVGARMGQMAANKIKK